MVSKYTVGDVIENRCGEYNNEFQACPSTRHCYACGGHGVVRIPLFARKIIGKVLRQQRGYIIHIGRCHKYWDIDDRLGEFYE